MANRKDLPAGLFGEDGVVCDTEEDTVRLGRAIGTCAEAGWVISLEGALGAGKTRLARGVAAGVGATDEVSSPTFAILHEYSGGRVPVFHFDFYRMEDPAELLTAGFDDCLDAGVTVVEWGNRFPAALPATTLRLSVEITGEGRRRVRARP